MIIVESIFNSPKFKRKQRISRLKNTLNFLLSILPLAYIFRKELNSIDWGSGLYIMIPLLIYLLIMGQISRSATFHNMKLKNQIDKIELRDEELVVTNYAEEKIIVLKNSCILYPVTDAPHRWYGRHKTDLLLTLEDGSCFYIYKELFNTHQIEDWKSDDANKRYYTV